jgi:triacylglycerol esterase/lipase EstA (alpha/beta hydrolase family)
VPKAGASADDYRRAERQARRIAADIRRLAAAQGVRVQVLVLAPAPVQGSARAGAVKVGLRTSARSVDLQSRSLAQDVTTTTVPITLAPRPTILLHGLWSNATKAWANYTHPSTGYQRATHPLWSANAVTGMNTGALLSPFGNVNTVSQNMEIAWTYLENVRTTLNAHEVDVVAHSMGGIITRRLLHSSHATQARAAIRSVVMLGTPNGGSSCADTWSVKATEPLRPTVMRTFNDSNPGYPGVISSLFYATPSLITCTSPRQGDSVVPEWSAKAQPVNTLVKATGSDCGSSFSSPCAILHTAMTTDRGWFRKYVIPQLALAEDPSEPTPDPAESIPTDDDVVLSQGTSDAGSVSRSVTVTLEANESLTVSIVTDEASPAFTATPGSGSPVALTKQDDQPVYSATIDGPLTATTVTLAGSTTTGIGWTFTKVMNGRPSAPVITGVTGGTGQVSIAFTTATVPTGASAITNYEVSTDGGSTWAATSPVTTASPITVSGLNAATYSVRIRAVNTAGAGVSSNAMSATVS